MVKFLGFNPNPGKLKAYLDLMAGESYSYHLKKTHSLEKFGRPNRNYIKLCRNTFLDLYRYYEPSAVYCWLICQWSLERFKGLEVANYDFQKFNPGLYSKEAIRKAFKILSLNGFIKYVYKNYRRAYGHVFPLRKILSAVGNALFKKIPSEYTYNTYTHENLPSCLDLLDGLDKNGPPIGYDNDLLYFLSKHQESLNFSKDCSSSNFKRNDSALDLDRPSLQTLYKDNVFSLEEEGPMDQEAIELLNEMDREREAKRRPSFKTSQDEVAYLFEKYGRKNLALKAGEFLQFCEESKIRKPCAALQAMFHSKMEYLLEDFRVWLHRQRTKDSLRFEKSREKEYENDNFKSKSFKSKSLGQMVGEFTRKNDIKIDNDNLQLESTTTDIPTPTLPTEETKDFISNLLERLAEKEKIADKKTIRSVKDCSFTLD